VDGHNDNGFMYACRRNPNVNVIRYLVNELKMNIYQTNGWGDNGFTRACYENFKLDVIRYLSDELKIDVNHTNNFGDDGFTSACYKSGLDVIRYLVDKHMMNVNRRNFAGDNGFNIACRCNDNMEIIKYLNEHTSSEQRIFGITFEQFAKIIMSQINTNRYARFLELLKTGIEIAQWSKDYRMNVLLNKINPLMMSDTIIKNFGMINPFGLKFKTFIKLFDVLSTNVKDFYARI
jgi:hypothetical protein